MKRFVGFLFVMATVSASAVCEVSDVAMTQGKNRRMAAVTYRLTGDDASIVTLSICTNSTTGATLDASDFVATGDVNRRVSATGSGESRRIDVSFAASVRSATLPEGVCAIVKAWALDNPPPVLTVNPSGTADDVRFYVSTNALPGGIGSETYKTNVIVLVRLPAQGATFKMGSEATQSRRQADETQHRVSFAEDFYIGVYPVTMAQYEAWMGACPRPKAAWSTIPEFPTFPAFGVSYEMLRGAAPAIDWPKTGHDVADASVLGTLRAKTAIAFDLPTEAQWEYACRAGTTTGNYKGSHNQVDVVLAIARVTQWVHDKDSPYAKNRNRYPWAVGGLEPNAFGLYDMLGNCCEWCLDWYGAEYGSDAAVEPCGPTTGESRVMRGISYRYEFYCCQSSRRLSAAPEAAGTAGAYVDEYGFRLVCPADCFVKGE